MRIQRLALALTILNLLLLVFSLTRVASSTPGEVGPTLRARVLELVDERGRVRSRLNVEPGGAVVLRLMDQRGTIRVKLGAGEDGSGLVLLDEMTEPGIHLLARRTGTAERPSTTSITLKAGAGREQVIRP
jgi:hypothetical protein